MGSNLAAIGYLVAAICFILALRGLSSPASSRQGNRFGMIGMTIAILVSLLILPHPGVVAYLLILVGDRDRRRHRLRRGAADRDDGDAAARGRVPLAGRPGRRVRRGGRLPLARRFRHHRPRRPHPPSLPVRDGPGHHHRRHHLLGLGDRLRQAAGEAAAGRRERARAADGHHPAGDELQADHAARPARRSTAPSAAPSSCS